MVKKCIPMSNRYIAELPLASAIRVRQIESGRSSPPGPKSLDSNRALRSSSELREIESGDSNRLVSDGGA